MRFYGAFSLIDHFINSLNQFRSVENCLDLLKINFNFEKEKNTFFSNFKNRVGILLYSFKNFFSEFQKIGAGGGGQPNNLFVLALACYQMRCLLSRVWLVCVFSHWVMCYSYNVSLIESRPQNPRPPLPRPRPLKSETETQYELLWIWNKYHIFIKRRHQSHYYNVLKQIGTQLF